MDSSRKQELSFRDKAKCLGLAQLLIPELRETARFHGYALTEHGSKQRDIDLVAIPWTEDCAEPEQLAEAIRKKTESLSGFAFAKPGEEGATPKPHGRMAWSFHLGGGPYIDLSVIRPHRDWGWEDRVELMSSLCRFGI